MGDLKGIASLDGQPIANGTVRFVPVDGMGRTGGADIKDGKFEAKLAVMSYRVEISAVQSGGMGKNKYVQGDIADVELIPKKYNANSELTIDVTPGLNNCNFELSAK